MRDEAQFLGTLHRHGPGGELEAAGALVHKALAVYGVVPGAEARPGFDADLTDAQKTEILADCSQLLLILAETEAQSTSRERPVENEKLLRKACLPGPGTAAGSSSSRRFICGEHDT